MRKGTAYLFMLGFFIAGIVVGVVITVLHEEKTPDGRMGSPLPSAGSSAQFAEINKRIESLGEILKKDPRNLQALIEIGNLYFDTDQAEKSIKAYSKALEIDPANADVRTDMAIMFRKKGDFGRAVSEFKKAAQADPKHVNSRYNLGVVLLHDMGDIGGAVAAWEEYLKVDPAGPRAENIRSQMGKMKEMVK
jgi:cytochrome c-type biogenesis protein CcmH/NrfG